MSDCHSLMIHISSHYRLAKNVKSFSFDFLLENAILSVKCRRVRVFVLGCSSSFLFFLNSGFSSSFQCLSSASGDHLVNFISLLTKNQDTREDARVMALFLGGFTDLQRRLHSTNWWHLDQCFSIWIVRKYNWKVKVLTFEKRNK